MSILTKEERREMREILESPQYSLADMEASDVLGALDTINMLEVDRDDLRKKVADLEDAVGFCVGIYQVAMDDFAEIHAYALEHSTTKVIGGAHAALRKIAVMGQ